MANFLLHDVTKATLVSQLVTYNGGLDPLVANDFNFYFSDLKTYPLPNRSNSYNLGNARKQLL